MSVGIYKITSPSGRVYIGQSKNIEKRFSTYRQDWFLKSKKQPRLRNSLNKYGVLYHKFEIVELCSVCDLDEKERLYQDRYNVTSRLGLNCVLISDGNKPHFRSYETRMKISLSKKGKKISDEAKLKISKFNLGKKLTQETKNKISKGNTGKTFDDKFKKEISDRMLGGGNHQSKIVLNTETGVFYETIKDAAISINMKPKTLSSLLNGYCKNKTRMVFVQQD